MGMIKDSFGWIFGVADKSIDSIDVQELEQKLRGTKRLQAQWEREIQGAVKEYNESISPEKNLQKTPIARNLSIQKAKIAAKRANTLTSAVTLLYSMSSVVDQVKLLKRFYTDLCETSQLPKGLSLEEFVQQVEKLSDVLHLEKKKIQEMNFVMENLQSSMEMAGTETASDKEMEALFEKYATLVAEGNTEEADQVKAKIDKKVGIASLA